MKKVALLLNYLTFLVLFTALMISSSITLTLVELVLVFAAAGMLFGITSRYNGNSGFHRFNYLFVGSSAIYACFVAFVESPFVLNITMYFWGASVIGLLLSIIYKQPKVKKTIKIYPPQRPTRKVVTKKVVKTPVNTSTKKASTKKVAKKAVKKSPAKKSTKKVTKKAVTKKAPAKKASTKKVAKKAVKKSPAKKSTKKVTKKVATSRRPKKIVETKRITKVY